jgi:hypothetical protein
MKAIDSTPRDGQTKMKRNQEIRICSSMVRADHRLLVPNREQLVSLVPLDSKTRADSRHQTLLMVVPQAQASKPLQRLAQSWEEMAQRIKLSPNSDKN